MGLKKVRFGSLISHELDSARGQEKCFGWQGQTSLSALRHQAGRNLKPFSADHGRHTNEVVAINAPCSLPLRFYKTRTW